MEDLTHEREREVEVVGRRVLACLLDCFLVTLPSSVALTPFLFVRPGLLLVLIMLLVFVLLFCILYFVYVVVFDGFRGRTLGKAFLGIEVVRAEDGGVPGPGRAALRALAFLFVDMLVGVFVMLISPERQRPGDMVANTLVVRKVNS
ncbi:MAG: RDD family protein [Actinomycetota bacterium]|nr:RDD family protein [Actinomycetota bacterium]